MIQADKDLLLKDLCCRLPYGVKASTKVGGNIKISFVGYDTIIGEDGDSYDISFITPYLFPLSSMTDEQKEEFNSYFASVPYYGDNIHIPYYFVESLIDFYNKHHLDWMGLIPKGLAIDATGKNIY